MLCLELEGLEESEVALSRSTGCAHVACELLGGEDEAFEVHQCAVLSVGVEPVCSTHLESRVVAGLCESSVALVSGRGREVPVAGVSLR